VSGGSGLSEPAVKSDGEVSHGDDGVAEGTGDLSLAGTDAAEARLGGGWRDIWQLPILLIALALLVGGLASLVLDRPSPDVGGLLESAERLLGQDRPQEALDLLNTRVVPALGTVEGDAQEAAQGRMHLLRARSLASAQRELGTDRAENHARIVEEFEAAESHGAALTPVDVSMLADSLVRIGRHGAALRRAALLPESEHARGTRILRWVVDSQMATAESAGEQLLSLLDDLLSREDVAASERAWAVARRAELLLASGRRASAMSQVLREIPKLQGSVGDGAIGELLVILARAYLAEGAVEEASRHATRGMELSAPGEGARFEAQLVLAEVDRYLGDMEGANGWYSAVVDGASDAGITGRALLGLAETAAGLGDDDASFEAYERLIDRLKGSEREAGVGPGAVVQSLLNRHGDRMAAGEFDAAIRYGKLAERVHGLDESPSEVLRVLADAHRRRALEMLGELGSGLDRALDLAELDPAERERARRDLIAAGSYYDLYADRMVLTDPEAHADALWLAADSYDQAGDREQALKGFGEFAEEISEDPRRPEARFRVARGLQARGEYGRAADIYLDLIRAGGDDAAKGVGPFAQASYVPLAQTYLLDEDTANDEEAERLLREVVSGRLGRTEAPSFADALMELGELLFEQGRYPEAIERLEEALARYGSHSRVDEVEYLLAEARRLEAEAVEKALESAAPDDERRALHDARVEHLRRAIDLYTSFIDRLGGMEADRLTALRRLRGRNAHFYRGACAFDLGEYEEARRHYEVAREAYPSDAASLASLVQVVNTYVAEGNWLAARAAQERAQRFYDSLPAEAWEDPGLPLRREDWERWLASTDRLARLAEVEDGGS